jgi:hypothetical protein
MTVEDLIVVLQTYPQHLPVAQVMYSEYCLLEAHKIEIKSLCKPRDDGWIQITRYDMPTQQYLVFPGN